MFYDPSQYHDPYIMILGGCYILLAIVLPINYMLIKRGKKNG